jgi:hypothetical protein
MNTKANSQVFGNFHHETITDDLYVTLPCLFLLVILFGRDSRPADANKLSNSNPTKQRQVLADDEVPTNQRISCRAWLDRNPSVQKERAERLSFSLDKNRASL